MASSVAPGVTSESRPVPDPTVLTTQQIFNSIAALRDVIDVRLAGMDQAVDLLQQAANRKPTIGELEARFEEKFRAICMVLSERERRDAALVAANQTAVIKAEVATNDSLSQLQALFQSSIGGLNGQVQDLKSRLDRGEGGSVRERETRNDNRNTHLDSRSLVFSVVASVAAIGAVLLGILNFVHLQGSIIR